MFGKGIHGLLVIAVAVLISQDTFAGSLSLLENTAFIRDKGKPKVETIQFDGQPGSQFQLVLYNGGADNQYCRITSAVILLNDQPVFSPSDFKQKTHQLIQAVNIESTNSLSVELRSKPGCAIEINVKGEPPVPTLSITSTPPVDAISGQVYRYQVTTSPEVDWGQLAVNMETAPAAMSVSDGLVEWTPTDQDEGQHPVSLEISHPDYGIATQAFSIGVLNPNYAPVANDLAVELVEDTSSVFSLPASDPDADTLTFTVTSPPQNGHLTLLDGQATYVPVEDFFGSDQFDYQVNDGEFNSNIATVTMTVAAQSDAPLITSSPITVAAENALYEYQIEALDVDGDIVTLQLDLFPVGMTLDSQSGLISWTPTSNQLGLQDVSVSAIDPEGLTDTQSFSIDVVNVNDAPVITSSAVTSINEREDYLYAVTATDPDVGDTLTFALDVAPVGMMIDTVGGQINWTPESVHIGSHPVVLVVTDAGGLSGTQTFTVIVHNVEDAPVITSTAIITATEDLSYNYDVEAEDPDVGDSLNFSLAVSPTGMTIDSVSGVISWTPLSNQTGDHLVSITVTDSTGLNATQDFTLNVANVNDAPEILSAPVTTARELEDYTYQLEVTDLDNDPVTYALTVAPAGMAISSTGLVSWTPALGQAGSHPVTLRVNDTNAASVEQSYTIAVDVVANSAPIASDATLTVAEDTSLGVLLTANDPDNDLLTYEFLSQPVNGSLTGTVPDLIYTPHLNFHGIDSFTFKVNDGIFDSNTATVSITVSSVNDAPAITSSPILNGVEMSLYQYQVQVNDPDSDTFSYSLTTSPAGMSIDVNGLIGWTPDYTAAGEHPVTVTVQDTLGASGEQSFTLTIADTNRAPVLEPLSDVTLEANTTLTLTLNASDADGDVLTYQVEGLPAFAHHQDTSIDLTPGGSDIGTHGPVVVTVSDGVDSQTPSFTITVVQGNRAPVITSTPTTFVIEGDEWRYTLVADDPDGESLTYAMIQAPSGAALDPATGLITWPTVGLVLGNYDFLFNVADGNGGVAEQAVSIEILPAERALSHVGTEFWIPVSHNMTTIAGGTFDINLVSEGTDTEATIEIAALGVVETLPLIAGQMATYSVNLDDFAATEGFTLNTLLENYAIHITAATPVAAYFMSQKVDTTDGFLGLPVASLGREYITATSIMLGKIGILATVDAGQPGPITTLVATENNTQVTIDPIMDIFTGGQGQIEAGTPIELTMNRGDVYNLETRGSFKADLTGSTIRADKPIGVFGQMDCVVIPVGYTACDHIIEQLPPVESLATEYYTAPFWGRTENGRFWYEEYGDTFRAVAPYDNTAVYIDGVLKVRLNRGEYFEFRSFNPQQVKASHPILLVQYANSNSFDEGYRELEADFTDPFMVVVPPAEQFLMQYTINTPARNLAYNFVNLLAPTAALSTLTLDGQSVDPVLFSEIPNSPYSYSQLPVTPGSHHIEAQEPFGVYVYGYDSFESYGYLGGMALSVGHTVASLSLTGDAAQTLDNPWCGEATALNAQGVPVNGARIRFNLAGATNGDAYRFADAHGVARYCYQGGKPGIDTVTASVNQLSQSVTVEWSSGTQNLPPVVMSLPDLEVVAGESFTYDLLAEDPEGEALVYTLVEGPAGMTIDGSGHLAWPQAQFSLTRHNREKVVLRVTDPLGLEAVQRFELNEYEPFNTPPTFGEADISLTATQGVPYVYNQEHIHHSLQYLMNQVVVSDADKDAAFVDILSGPDEAYIQRINAWYTGDTRENDPRSMVGVIHYLRWIPQEVGEQAFELGLRDARGGTAQSRSLTVNVLPNLPPQIVDFNPSSIASMGYQYSYILNVENDVPPHAYANLDDLKVVFEQAPAGMRYDLVLANGTQKLHIYWTPNNHQLGTHTVRLHVEDRLNSSTTEEFTINVVDDNQPPVITAGGMPNAEVSIPYEYQINASDPDGDALTYSLAIAPEGMTVNENTGMISWVPTDRYSNTNAWVRYVVTDAQGLTVEQRQLVNIAAFSNRAPEFIPAYRPTYAKVGREYTHQPQAIDREGDYPITYRLSSYSPEPTIDSENGTISWTPTTEGSFWITVAATDSLGNFASNRQITWYVEVVPATTPLGVDLQLTPAEPIDLGESVTLNVVPINSATTPQVSLTVDGEVADLDALLASTITPDRVGRIPVTVTVSDGYETVERTAYVVVRDPNDTTPPVVELVSPVTATTVTSLTDIIGTAQDDNLTEVRLAYKRADQSDAEYIDLYRGSRSFDNEIIANLDPSLLVNGIYHILLQATDSNNNVMGRRASVFVDGDRKVGQFSFTVEDLELSLAGIPITVSRTYDSRRRTEALDFGYGWTVDYQNVRLEESQEPTQGWYQTLSQNETFWVNPGYVNTNAICIYPVSEKTVSVTLANKEVEKFRVVARPSNGLEGAVSDPNCYMSTDRTYDLFFEAIDGTQSTLETADAQSLYLSDLDNGYLATAGDGQAQPVTRYTLTTRTGYVYQLNQGFGVERITDPNGHTLTYSDSGISHSDGKQVTFTRDAQGRISAITDPMGHGFEYTYNTNGDLVRFTDPTTAATQYTYNNQHGLIDIIDPLDRSVLRNHYDDDGRLYAQEDGAGNWKYFDHNLTANSTVVTDLDGRVTLYNYDDQGNVLSETQVIADNSYSGDIITRYTYDANGNQESKAIGESTWITRYDEHNDLQTAIDPEGGAILYENYTPYGQAGRLTDERGHRYEMNYDTAGNLNSILAPQVTNPDTGEVTQAGASNIINATGRIESTTDMRGHTTAYTYYPAGHEWAGWKQTESSPVTGAITYTYDTNGNVKSEIRERTVDGVVTTETTLHDYDERNRLTKTTYPDGSYIETVYDLAGNVDLERDRFGNWTDYDYDPYGRLTLTTYPDTTSELREYTREGLLERIIDRSGHTTRNEYDDAGRLWRTHYEEAGSYTETRYTEQGWVSQAWDENRNLTEYEYDRAGRRTAVIRYLDDVTTQRHEFSYYRNGELHTETDANQRTTTYVLNELDQRIRTEYPNTTTSEQRFDAMGARIGMIDQNAVATSYGYDPQGRLERVTPEVTINGESVPDTGYSYDEQGNKLSQTDANGRTTTWAYDSFGRVIRRTLPEGMHETFVYDDSARTQTHTDFNGDITLTRYDAMGRISSIDYQKDGTRIDYTYWPNDQVRTVTDPQGTTEYSYDNRDRLASRINPDGSRIDYAYDNVGNRTRVSVSDASGAALSQTSYGYDALDRLTRVTDASGTTQYTYDNVSNLDTVTYPNGMVTDYDYNSVNQLTHVTTRDASDTLVGSYSYTLDDTGRRETITEASGRITDYAYDDLYRLTGETITDSVNGDYSAGYQYDWVGNRTGSTIDGVQTAYTYDRNDRLTRQGGTSYTYDNNGNTLTETLDSTTTTYSYNARNELVSVVQGGNTTEYGYNPNGIRSSKRENGVTTRYIVDENRDYAQVLIEDDGTAQVSYTYGDDLISQDRSGEIHYYHYDGLGSTRSLTDSQGNLANTYDYEAFGEVLSQTGTIENRYLFAGEQFDSTLDQYYLRARYYDPSQGRFTQQDTWMGRNHDPITLHKYLYANADPVLYIDPTGHFSLSSLMSGINVMSRLVTTAIRVPGSKLGGTAIGRAIKATGITAIGALVKNEVKRCYASRGKRCRIPNLIVIGSDYPEAQKHIDDAQKGRGSNGFPISPLVTYKRGSNKSRDWLTRTKECAGNVFRKTGKSCDEYPFAASKEGGQKRYRQNKVSLRLMDNSQNVRAGQVYGRAVTKGKNGDKYLIAPYGPFSFYYSNGKFGL